MVKLEIKNLMQFLRNSLETKYSFPEDYYYIFSGQHGNIFTYIFAKKIGKTGDETA